MSINPESLYKQLAALLAEMPELDTGGDYGEIEHGWLSKAFALVEASGDLLDAAALRDAATRIGRVQSRESLATTIHSIVYRALARAELRAPPQVQGAFVAAGETFTAFQALSRVMGTAETDLLIVDSYLSAHVLSEYGLLLDEGVPLRFPLDSRRQQLNDGVRSAVERWVTQFGSARPLEARVADESLRLHDRLLIIDHSTVWLSSQSLKDFANHAHASLQRADAELTAAKQEAYEEIWNGASPL